MAKVKPNSLLKGLSGKLGKDWVFRTLRDGTVIVAAAPDFSNRVLSEEQLAHQSRFQKAAAYARVAAKSNPIYAELAKGTSKNAYNLALFDWFNPPVIHEVSRLPGRIRVDATDNVQVTQVLVTIADEQGIILEQGSAAPIYDGAWWEYETLIEGNIIIEVSDPAGNVTRQEV